MNQTLTNPDQQLNESDATYKMSVLAALEADDRKAEDILVIAVGQVSVLADYFVIATGRSKAQVRAIANAIKLKIATELNRQPLRLEGESDAGWILQDYGDVIVHIMMPTEREFYSLESFWGHAPKVALTQLGTALQP